MWLRFMQSLASQPAFSRALAETGWINVLLTQLQTDKLTHIDPVMHVSNSLTPIGQIHIMYKSKYFNSTFQYSTNNTDSDKRFLIQLENLQLKTQDSVSYWMQIEGSISVIFSSVVPTVGPYYLDPTLTLHACNMTALFVIYLSDFRFSSWGFCSSYLYIGSQWKSQAIKQHQSQPLCHHLSAFWHLQQWHHLHQWGHLSVLCITLQSKWLKNCLPWCHSMRHHVTQTQLFLPQKDFIRRRCQLFHWQPPIQSRCLYLF